MSVFLFKCYNKGFKQKLTSAKIKGESYFLVSSPSLMALSEAGPQQKTPEK